MDINYKKKKHKVFYAYLFALLCLAFIPIRSNAQTISNLQLMDWEGNPFPFESYFGWAHRQILPGDTVIITADISGIPSVGTNFLVRFNGEGDFITPLQVIPDYAGGELFIKFLMPVNIPYLWNTYWHNFRVYAVNGSQLVAGIDGVDEYLAEYGNVTVTGGERQWWGRYNFDGNGPRSIKSDKFNIHTTVGASLEFALMRLSEQVPPANGFNLVLEYSTNSTAWSRIGDTIKLGGANAQDLKFNQWTYFNFTGAQLTGIVSANTEFRIRQTSSDNGAELHSWALEDFYLYVPDGNSNEITSAEVLPGGEWVKVQRPSVSLNLLSDSDSLYPGFQSRFAITQAGLFPSGTTYHLISGSDTLRNFISLQNFNLFIPWYSGSRTFILSANPNVDGVSTVQSSVTRTINGVYTDITSHVHNFTDSNIDYNMPGKEISVNYNIFNPGNPIVDVTDPDQLGANGIINTQNSPANVVLQIWHDNSNQWITIRSQALTNTVIRAGSGAIVGTIPPQLAAYESNPVIRVIVENYNETFAWNYWDVRMVHPTVSLEKIDPYLFGQTVDIQYSTFEFNSAATDIHFALVLEQGSVRHVLTESNQKGEATFTGVTMPTADELETAGFTLNGSGDFNGQLRIYAYDKSKNPNELLVETIFSNPQWLEISSNKFYITRGQNLTNQPSPVVLSFDYEAFISVVTTATLPQLQVSTDNGVTYTTVKVEDSPYADYDRLPSSIGWSNFRYEIPASYLTANTHFRWFQEVSEVGNWAVGNVQILSGESNLVDFYVNYIPVTRTIFIGNDNTDPYGDYDNIDGYSWELVDNDNDDNLDPVAVVGQLAEYRWNMSLDGDGNPTHVVWPAGTKFQFTMNITDPETGDDYIFATTTDTGAFTFILPDFVTTGEYDVYADARIEDGDGTLIHNNGTVYQTSIFVLNETTPDHLHLTFLGITPEDDNDEYHFGQQITIKYDQYGPWPVDVKLLPVLRLMDGGNVLERHTLTVDAAASTPGNLVVTLPSFVKKQNSSDEFKIQMYAHTGENIILADYELELTDEQMDVINGRSGGSGNWYDFYDEGKRQLITKALDLSGLDAATAELTFSYEASSITENPATLPRLSVSVDGGATFTPLANELSAFGAMGYLPSNGWYSVSIPLEAAYLTAATHFKWEQGINRDDWADEWYLWDIYIKSGISNVFSNYGATDFPKTVNMVVPSIAVDYVFEITRDADGFEPVIYPGNAVAFTWGLTTDVDGNVIGKEFPAGSQFEYFIQGYPTWSDYYPVEFTLVDAATNAYTMTLPEDIKRDDYSLVASVSVDGIYFEEHTWIGSLKVYNHLVVTVYNEEAPVLFAGNNASFTAQLESALPGNTFDNVYFNLILRDNSGNDWLLAVNQGLANNFDVALPPFVNGNRNFRVEASLNAPMGVVGSILESAGSINYLDVTNNWISDGEGSRSFVTTDPAKVDMLDANYISFQLKISESIANLTEDQKLVFEYSVNEGFTYTTLATYPDARFNDAQYFENQDLTDWFNETIELPAAANTENTMLRWRIEENKAGNDVEIRDIELKPYPADYIAAPFISMNRNVNIVEQRVDITTTNDASYCNEDVIEFAYNIRGKFGANTKLTLKDDNGDDLAVFEGITEGSGTIQVELDGNLSGSAVQFRIVAEDKTVADYNYTVWGEYTDYGVEIIAQVDQNSNLNADGTTCATAERVLTISDAQTNFVYQLRDVFTQALIGNEVVVNLEDEDLMDADTYPYFDGANLMISLGQISDKVTVEAVVTPQSKNRDKACDVKVINNRATFESRPEYSLHFYDDNTGAIVPYAGSEIKICSNWDYELVMGYYNSNGSFVSTSADWYRDDMTMPLGNNSWFGDYVISGNYFAVVNDGDCGIYQSALANVNVVQKPEQPSIAAVGSANVCDGETVTLNGTEGFNYYQWTLDGWIQMGGNSSTLVTDWSGSYQLRVSNEPFNNTSCASNYSAPVTVSITELNNVWFDENELTLCPSGDNTATVVLYDLQHGVTYQLINLSTGLPFGQTFSSTGYSWMPTAITTPALTGNEYGVMATHDANGCSKMLGARLVVNTLPQYHTLIQRDGVYELALDQNGNPTTFTGCEGDMTLGLGEANGTIAPWWSDVKWYKDGMFIGEGTTRAATESGVYSAVYTNDNTNNDVCQYSSVATTLVIGAKPARPVVTPSGALEFCEGSSDLILTAPTAASYRWTRNHSTISNVSSSDNTLSVTTTGDYRVTVADAIGCESEPSIAISATVHQLPKMEDFNVLSPVLCEANIAQVQIPNAEYDVMYQLFNVVTGENTGAARMGVNNLVISSDELTENGTFGIRAYRLNADACDVTFAETFKVKVYNLEVEASGNMLIASVADASSYQWYRNGIAINRGNQRTLLIYDNASYSVKVVTADGCTLDSSVGGGKDGEERPTNTTTLDVYPNPSSTSTTLLIAGAASGDIRVRVVNPSGGVVYEQVINKQTAEVKHEIPVYQLTPGVYVIQAVGQNYIETKQFIKF
jgi:hypothetical protein